MTNIAIPYKHFGGPELKYTLRGIEKYIKDPQITLIGDRPLWVTNITFINASDDPQVKWKERNIFYKLLHINHDFLFFNDDHFLLKPFNEHTYHYSGVLSEDNLELGNPFRQTIRNTIELYGIIPNYYRHSPMFMEYKKMDKIRQLDWNKPWGYCIKSIYCRVNNIKGTNYPDLKIRKYMSEDEIRKLIKGRAYFSTSNNVMNKAMLNILDELYPTKSKFEA